MNDESNIEPIDLGTLDVPEVEVLDQPWIFRGATHFKEPKVIGRRLHFGLILDLGFGIYRQIDAVLDGVFVKDEFVEIVVAFAENWAANGHPNPLVVECLRENSGKWHVKVARHELDVETLQVVEQGALAAALEEQGLVD